MFTGIAAARLHLRARRPGAVPAARRRRHAAAGKAAPDELLEPIAEHRRHGLLHRADRLPRDAGASSPSTTSRRCANACPPARPCRRRPSRPGTRATGIEIIDGIGATEMLHIFIGSPDDEIRPGATGRPVPGYEARVVDADGNEVAARHARPARRARARPAAATSPTTASASTCSDGWNITGDTYLMDADGYFWYQARTDDMIVSRRLQHRRPGGRDGAAHAPGGRRMRRGRGARRGARQIVKAYVVLKRGLDPCLPRRRGRPRSRRSRTTSSSHRALQVPARRSSSSQRCPAPTGKLQRFRLRQK